MVGIVGLSMALTMDYLQHHAPAASRFSPQLTAYFPGCIIPPVHLSQPGEAAGMETYPTRR
jgi:hypothetical protein